MTKGDVVTPERLHHHLARHSWVVLSPFVRHPWTVLSGVHGFENQRKSKNMDSRLKISGMTEEV